MYICIHICRHFPNSCYCFAYFKKFTVIVEALFRLFSVSQLRYVSIFSKNHLSKLKTALCILFYFSSFCIYCDVFLFNCIPSCSERGTISAVVKVLYNYQIISFTSIIFMSVCFVFSGNLQKVTKHIRNFVLKCECMFVCESRT